MIYAAWMEDKSAKEQHDIAWKLLGHALKKEYGIELLKCTIEKNKWGRPSLKEYQNINFSISHCANIAVCILAETEIGIDVEMVGRTCKENVWRRMLSKAEYENIISKADKAERDKEFLKYWTLKESYGKAIGKGLSYDYKEVVFSLEGEDIICNLPDYSLWQTVIDRNNKEVVLSVCRKQIKAFKESIEWISI